MCLTSESLNNTKKGWQICCYFLKRDSKGVWKVTRLATLEEAAVLPMMSWKYGGGSRDANSVALKSLYELKSFNQNVYKSFYFILCPFNVTFLCQKHFQYLNYEPEPKGVEKEPWSM